MFNLKDNNKDLRKVYWYVLSNNIKKHGILWVIKKVVLRGFRDFGWALLLPISVCLHILGVRRLLIRVEHIGHLAAEFDTHMKAKILNLLPKHHRFYFVLAPKKSVSNTHLLAYWAKHFNIISNPLVCAFLSVLTRHFFMRYDISAYISKFFGTQEIYRINNLWDKREPLLTLSEEDEKWGNKLLEKLGVCKGQWFVCLHVRESGFLPHNEIIQSHRNATIANMKLAIQEIITRGGVVIRMGDSSMTPLKTMPGLIDYAHHPLKSERLDIILCAKAKFFLGCTSGLSFVSMIFGVPVAQANMVPMQALAIRRSDLSIPKLLWNEHQKRYLHFNEIMASKIGGFYFTHQYQEADIRIDENTPNDLLLLTSEMLDRLDGKFIETEEDKKLHLQYMSLFKPGHYSYGAISQVCIGFLRSYQFLYDSD